MADKSAAQNRLDVVDEAALESFPASDPPSWTVSSLGAPVGLSSSEVTAGDPQVEPRERTSVTSHSPSDNAPVLAASILDPAKAAILPAVLTFFWAPPVWVLTLMQPNCMIPWARRHSAHHAIAPTVD